MRIYIYAEEEGEEWDSICLPSYIYIFTEVEREKGNIPTLKEASPNDKQKTKRKHQSLVNGWSGSLLILLN